MPDSQLADQYEIEVCVEGDPTDDPSNIAELKISAAGSYLTTLYDAEEGRRREFLRASASTFALWIAHKWWRLTYEPLPAVEQPDVDWRMSHELTSISQDTIWPPIMIYGDGSIINISPRIGRAASLGPISYEAFSTKFVRIDTFTNALDTFFTKVCEVFASAADVAALKLQLINLKCEREDPEFAAWRRLEARLGYDCGAVPDSLMVQYSKLADAFGEAAISEAASATPGPTSATIMENAVDAARSGIVIKRDAVAGDDLAASPHTFSYPWLAAEAEAGRVRKCLSLSDGPISSKALGDILNVDFETVREVPAAQHLPYGAIVSDGTYERMALNSWPHAVPRRFELARVLGDATWDKTAKFVALSSAKTERQKYQRAFAQSFLCPFSSLQAYIGSSKPTDDAINAAATHFRVSERLIRSVLVNKRVLPREALSAAYEAI